MERIVATYELRERGPALIVRRPAFDDAAALVAAGKNIFGTTLFCTQVGPVLGARLGSGCSSAASLRAPAE